MLHEMIQTQERTLLRRREFAHRPTGLARGLRSMAGGSCDRTQHDRKEDLHASDASRIAKLIEKHDTSLANQLRRCASSVPLNIREGSGSFGGHRKQRYHTALGSSGEVLACYDTAEAMGYIDVVGSEARRRVDHVIGTLVNVLRLRR